MAKLKDSGNRREFVTGAVRDMAEGKGRCDLLPLDVVVSLMDRGSNIGKADLTLMAIDVFKSTGDPDWLENALWRACQEGGIFSDVYTLLLEVSKQFEDGAAKYGDNNWQKGIPADVYVDSGVRHYLKHLRGDRDEPHDRAFAWNMVCAIWTCRHMPDLNPYSDSDTHIADIEATESAD